ncbi:MAG: hypothetical protein HY235_01310 [Acidobacteria bacterium]|nr:hypothetical protein [Acidobacteriota bacterium]
MSIPAPKRACVEFIRDGISAFDAVFLVAEREVYKSHDRLTAGENTKFDTIRQNSTVCTNPDSGLHHHAAVEQIIVEKVAELVAGPTSG